MPPVQGGWLASPTGVPHDACWLQLIRRRSVSSSWSFWQDGFGTHALPARMPEVARTTWRTLDAVQLRRTHGVSSLVAPKQTINDIEAASKCTGDKSYDNISRSVVAARFVFRIVRSLLNLTGGSAALLPIRLSNLTAISQWKLNQYSGIVVLEIEVGNVVYKMFASLEKSRPFRHFN